MFPPPGAARYGAHAEPQDLLVIAKVMEDVERQRSTPGPRLSTPSSGAGRKRLIERWPRRYILRTRAGVMPRSSSAGGLDPKQCRTEKKLGQDTSQNRVEPRPLVDEKGGATSQPSAWSVEGSTTEPPPVTPSFLDQAARDNRLAQPRHPPKFGAVAARGYDRLFGKRGLLPLESQLRAKARSQATMSARSRFQCNGCSGDQRGLLSQTTGNEYRTISNGVGGYRCRAWDGRRPESPTLQHARHILGVRRCEKESPRLPTPASVSESSSRGGVQSEDSISTDALLYGALWGIEEAPSPIAGESPVTRHASEGALGEPSGYEETRRMFFAKFRAVADKKQSNPVAHVTSVEEESIRARAWRPSLSELTTDPVDDATAKFLRQLSDNHRAPWPAILKLGTDSRTLEVGGMGLGDDLVAALATVMPILRGVERLVAFDNRMTDFSVFRVVKAVQGMPSLTYLDLSENEVGALAAHELRDYMRSKECRLKHLAIRKADIDDAECREFMGALENNISLVEVDLTQNLIGTAESFKVTGGDSVAAMLSVNCTLTSLNLGWNSIRMASAVTLADSLKSNNTLVSLGLAYNSFSDYASQRLAVALIENNTLTSLDLSYNSVTPAAAMVLAFALKVNTTMKFVELEGNRIGQNGGEALVLAMRASTRREGNLIVSVKNCDTSHNDETLFNSAAATGEYTLDLQVPYHKVVASELLRLANRKPTASFRSLKHVVGKKVTNVKLHREQNAAVRHDSCADTTSRIKYTLGTKGKLEPELFAEYAHMMGMRPDEEVMIKLVQSWNAVLARDPTTAKRVGNSGTDSDHLVTLSFFEALFLFADKDAKGELGIDDLEALFQELGLPHSEARMRHVMTKYDADHSGAIGLNEFVHYMSTSHVKHRYVDHGVLCTEDRKEWHVPNSGILRVHFVEEPNADRTLAEVNTDAGVEGLISNIRQSANDDSRKRLFELATANSGTFFTASQAQGLLQAVASNYSLVDAVVALMPQMASTQECHTFVDSNLDHRGKLKSRFMVGAAWGTNMGMPSGHYSLDMQSSRDRLVAQQVAAVANHERQHSKFTACVNTSQQGNWQNFRNAQFKREPIILTPGWFVTLPKYGVLRFDYVSTSRPDHHQIPLPERRFQGVMAKLGVAIPITASTPIDEQVISEDALRDACTSHWRKIALSSDLYKIDMRNYYRSGSSLDDVSLASWWSAVDVTSVDVGRKTSFAHLAPSDTYVKAWYKLKELEVALCSAYLTTEQLARILENFPREYQIRAEVVIAFYHKVTDADQMCLLIDSLRPDESREVFARRGFLNVVNPIFADRYYRLDLAVWDEREMAKILIKLAMMEPGENWIDETYERKVELGPLPGWELPLDWTTPDVTAEKKDGGPRRVGILTLWYASAPQLGCSPNLAVRQDLVNRTICSRVGTPVSAGAMAFDIATFTFRQQQRFRSMLDKARQERGLLIEEIAMGFTKNLQGPDSAQDNEQGLVANGSFTTASSVTEYEPDGGFTLP